MPLFVAVVGMALVQGCDQPPADDLLRPPPLDVEDASLEPAPHQALTPAERGSQGRAPPIPAELSLWAWDAGGFVPSHGWYGEPSWDDVRMRLAGQLAALQRDRARLAAGRSDYAGAAQRYGELAGQLDALGIAADGSSAARTRDLLLAAALRDQALCAALARREAPLRSGEGLADLRAGYLGLALRHAAGSPASELADDARSLQAGLLPFLDPRPDLDLGGFEDFASRHELRVRLVQAYLDVLDPIGLDERWGAWTAAELERQALLLGVAAGHLGGDDWAPRLAGRLVGESPGLDPADALRWPSMLAAVLRTPDQLADFTAEDLGRLPTGDSLLDVGGQPGPEAIGELERLGLDDEQHRAWLEQQAEQLDMALASEPGRVLAVMDGIVDQLDSHGHGSRYYNIKQARNSAVRQLARAGEYALAREVLQQAYPLHNQDWACPNREGILSALEGRLLAEAGELEAAERVLARGVDQTLAFADLVARAEQSEPGLGPPPPQLEAPSGAPQER